MAVTTAPEALPRTTPVRIGWVSSVLRANVTTAVGSVAPGLTNSNRPSIASGVLPSFRSFTTAESPRTRRP